MTAPRTPHLRRDNQQWVFDRTIRDDGRVFHFQPRGRGNLPESVAMHSMIPKHLGLAADRLRRLGALEAEQGHDASALDRYFLAASLFGEAQHAVLRLTAEKKFLHDASLACYDKVRDLAPYRIEKIDVEWEGTMVSGTLHLAPGADPAPLIFMIPGCDMTKEMYPHPQRNHALERGLHLFVFDGPGQGESNMRGIRLTTDNYERATSAVLDVLAARPEVDVERLGLFAMSFGSYWGVRVAAHDDRFSAMAAPWASVADKYYLMEEESPRYKQLFRFLTQAASEAELDDFIAEMDLRPLAPRITCPTLLTAGEFDPRGPLDEIYEFFDLLTCAKEMWTFGDQHHMATLMGPGSLSNVWNSDVFGMSFDWLADRLAGREVDRPPVTFIDRSDEGPYAPAVRSHRYWWEQAVGSDSDWKGV